MRVAQKKVIVAALVVVSIVLVVLVLSRIDREQKPVLPLGRADDPWRHQLADTLRKALADSLSVAYLLNIDGEVDSVDRASADIIVQEYLDSILFSSDCRIDRSVLGKDTCLNDSPRLLDSISIINGVVFLEKHEKILNVAKSVYKVPPEVVTSILRIETDFGKSIGCYKVLNTLVTLFVSADPDSVPPEPPESFEKRKKAAEKRRSWAFNQLKFYLLLAKANDWDVFSMVGSNRAAFGWAQFLPETYFFYAHDGDGDGKINFFEPGDAIFNIAHYLAEHGWTKNKLRALQRYNRGKYKYNVIKYAEEVKKAYEKEKLSRKKKKK